jgi:hypothetical protein
VTVKAPYRPVSSHPGHHAVALSTVLAGQAVESGARLRIIGEKGTFRFRQHVLNTETGREWIDVVGGDWKSFRAFRPARVERVLDAALANQPDADLKEAA